MLDDIRLNMNQQCVLAVKRANHILGHIKHSIMRQSGDRITPLWPHLECCMLFWSPKFKKNVKVFECVHEKAPNLVKGLAGMSYEEWLKTEVLRYGEKEAEG